MCARIGKATGLGLAANFKQRFPAWLLRVVIVALLAANSINIGADLAGMADAAEVLSGINSHLFCTGLRNPDFVGNDPTPLHHIANVLKWLVLVLFAYPITAFVVGADWAEWLVRPSYPRCHTPEMNGRCWWRFLEPRPVRICSSGRQVKRLKRRSQQVRLLPSYVQLPRDRRQQLLPAIKFESKLRCTQSRQLYALRSCRSCPGRILLPS
jgi:hypothetical protein